MAATKPVIKAALIARLNAFETPIDSDRQDDFADAMADWIVSDVLPLLQVTGATGTGTPGGPLPIAIPAGGVT